jgi:hypothetical protein
MTDLGQALKSHLQELDDFYFGASQATGPDSHELPETEIDKLEYAFDVDALVPSRRGRPSAHRSRDQRTFQSFQAFVFVTGEKRTFRQRHRLTGVPEDATNKFIEFAKRLYPLARKETVREHLRKDQGLLPHYDEPTCFQVVRYEYEDGAVGTVVLAGPSNGRLSESESD